MLKRKPVFSVGEYTLVPRIHDLLYIVRGVVDDGGGGIYLGVNDHGAVIRSTPYLIPTVRKIGTLDIVGRTVPHDDIQSAALALVP